MDDHKAQVYIKIDEYRRVKDTIAQTMTKLQQARVLLDKLSALNGQENETLTNWGRELDEMGNKVDEVDKALFEPKI